MNKLVEILLNSKSICALSNEKFKPFEPCYLIILGGDKLLCPPIEGVFFENHLEEYDKLENSNSLDKLTEIMNLMYDEIIDNIYKWYPVLDFFFVKKSEFEKTFKDFLNNRENLSDIEKHFSNFSRITNQKENQVTVT